MIKKIFKNMQQKRQAKFIKEWINKQRIVFGDSAKIAYKFANDSYYIVCEDRIEKTEEYRMSAIDFMEAFETTFKNAEIVSMSESDNNAFYKFKDFDYLTASFNDVSEKSIRMWSCVFKDVQENTIYCDDDEDFIVVSKRSKAKVGIVSEKSIWNARTEQLMCLA